MTVKDFTPDGGNGEYLCQWFSGASLKQGRFPQDSVSEAVAPAEPSDGLAERLEKARKRAKQG